MIRRVVLALVLLAAACAPSSPTPPAASAAPAHPLLGFAPAGFHTPWRIGP